MNLFSKKIKLLILMMSSLLQMTLCLYAQGHKFEQKIQWQAEKNAIEYKVEVKDSSGEMKSLFYETEENFVKLSLPAGHYQYRVYAYDFLGRESSVSEWTKFEITKAVAPEIKKTAEKVTAPVSKNDKVQIAVNIESVTEESQVELVNVETKEAVKGVLKFEKTSGSSVASKAEFPKVAKGEWKLKVTNPSGLSSESESLSIVDKAEEDARLKAEAEALAKAKAEEEARLKAEAEALAKAKAEEEARLKAEAEALAKAKAEEEARLKAEAEALAKAKAEEEAQLKAEAEALAKAKAEEEARLKAEAEALAKAQAEEEKAKKKQEAAERRKNRKLSDSSIGAFGGICISPFEGEFLEKCECDFTPVVMLKIESLPIKGNGFKFGFDCDVKLSYMKNQNDYYELFVPFGIADLNLVFQKSIYKDKVYLSLKGGADIFVFNRNVHFTNAGSRKDPESEFHGYIGCQGGLALAAIPAKRIKLEVGADYNHIFMNGLQSGFLIPYAGLGVRW